MQYNANILASGTITAPSGIFAESLTISGVPVATGVAVRYTDAEAIAATEPSRYTVSGTLSAEIDSDIATHTAIADAHHTRYTDAEAVSGTEAARYTMSGTLSSEIDSDIATHAAISGAHHTRYTDTEAITALEPTTSALAASGVATDAQVDANRTEFVNASGSLQTQIDAVEASDVDSVNAVTGDVTISGVGKVYTSTAGQVITVSGLPDDVDVNHITVSGIDYAGDVTISGLGGVIVAPGTDPQTITVSGEVILPQVSGQAAQEDPDGTFLTINRVRIGYGKDGSTHNAYLRVEGVASSNTGHVMMREARMTGVAGYYDGGAAAKTFVLMKNGDTTPLAWFDLEVGTPYVQEHFTPQVDFATGDRVQIFVSGSGTSISDPNMWLEIGWKAI